MALRIEREDFYFDSSKLRIELEFDGFERRRGEELPQNGWDGGKNR